MHFKMLSAICFNLDKSKILSSGNELKVWKIGNRFNSLANNKILDWLKLKAFADDKINMTEKMKFVLGRWVD